VVVAYEATGLLRRCLTDLSGSAADVIVVDNAAPSSVAQLVRTEFPAMQLVEPGRNAGFGAGANTGAARSRGRWILFLNPDAWPVADAVDRLVDFAEREPRIGAVGPLLVDPDRRPQRSTIAPPLGAVRLALWAALPSLVSGAYATWRRTRPKARDTGVRENEFLIAAALLVRREAFERIGGFDEGFFMFGEDADLCFRLREAGWRVELCAAARFVHVGGGSTRSDPVGMYQELLRSWLRLIAKRQGLPTAERARRLLVAALALRGFVVREERDRAARVWLASTRASDLLSPP
jgi:N-acetylglucosaminyl-diphospho-decaprenol L-rhamnosyltransferase